MFLLLICPWLYVLSLVAFLIVTCVFFRQLLTYCSLITGDCNNNVSCLNIVLTDCSMLLLVWLIMACVFFRQFLLYCSQFFPCLKSRVIVFDKWWQLRPLVIFITKQRKSEALQIYITPQILLNLHKPCQKTRNICITFVQCWTNVEAVCPTLYKCHTNVSCLLWCLGGTLIYDAGFIIRIKIIVVNSLLALPYKRDNTSSVYRHLRFKGWFLPLWQVTSGICHFDKWQIPPFKSKEKLFRFDKMEVNDFEILLIGVTFYRLNV